MLSESTTKWLSASAETILPGKREPQCAGPAWGKYCGAQLADEFVARRGEQGPIILAFKWPKKDK